MGAAPARCIWDTHVSSTGKWDFIYGSPIITCRIFWLPTDFSHCLECAAIEFSYYILTTFKLVAPGGEGETHPVPGHTACTCGTWVRVTRVPGLTRPRHELLIRQTYTPVGYEQIVSILNLIDFYIKLSRIIYQYSRILMQITFAYSVV